ncbi:MAG: DUF2878 domain-containing protein [Proteobacteria bacterium]|nr:DUF2878 domain-containing protein [Pseudomonadota bacterium]
MLYFVNFTAYQAGWFSSVYGGAQQMPWLGPLAVALALLLHFRFASGRRAELMLILSCTAIGAVFDSALVAMGWVLYPSGMFSEFAAPFWIITLWTLFATTLNVSMRWLRDRQALASICGLAGGPLTYLAGQKLGGIVLLDPLAACLALGVGWAMMMPMLLRLSSMFDGFAVPAGNRMVKAAVVESGT